MDPGALGNSSQHSGHGGGGGAPPLGINRVNVPVNYVTSVGVATAQTVAHLYVVSENEARLPRGREPQKRLLSIADRATFQSDMDVAMARCVMFSQVKNVMLHEDHVAPLSGPFCEYDMLIQQSNTFDFIRTIAAVFKPHSIGLPTFTVEDGRMLTESVECRLAPSAFHDVVGTAAQEASLRQLRSSKDREVVALQEALQKQKDESLLEMVELHTQNESLKHSLSQAEQALIASRRAFKEEKDLLVAKLRQYDAERDVRSGRMPYSPPSADTSYGGGGGSYQQHSQQQQPQQPSYGGMSPQRSNNGHVPAHMQAPGGGPVWGVSAGHGGQGGPSQAGPSGSPVPESFEISRSHAGTSPGGGGHNASFNQSHHTPGVRPGGSADAPFATSQTRSSYAQPSGSWGGNTNGLMGPPGQPTASGAYGGAGRSPRAAFEHLEKTLSDGERFLANTQRRAGGASY